MDLEHFAAPGAGHIRTMYSGRLVLTGSACRMEGTGGGGATVNFSREALPGMKLVAQLALMCHRFYSGEGDFQ